MNELIKLLRLECYWIPIKSSQSIILVTHLDDIGSLHTIWRYDAD